MKPAKEIIILNNDENKGWLLFSIDINFIALHEKNSAKNKIPKTFAVLFLFIFSIFKFKI